MRTFSTHAWIAWAVSAATLVLAIADPWMTVSAIIALAWVATVFARRGPEGRSYLLMLKIGAVATAIRIVLFSLTGHTGPTTLLHVPVLALPAWLGGFSLGGRVTAEVAGQAAAEGLTIVAFLVCFGVFLSVVESYRLLRMLPPSLSQAGLVVCIAVTFVPSLLRTAADIRDAQRLRGHRFRGIRSARALVAPLLAGALERSLSLAASMESRGYGRTGARDAASSAKARRAALAGLVALIAAAGSALASRTLLAAIAGVGALTCFAFAERTLARGRLLTRMMRQERSTAWDRTLVIVSVGVVVGAIVARGAAWTRWYPYPAFHAPVPDIAGIALAACLAAPVPLAALRARRLERASAPNDRASASDDRALTAAGGV